jgi:uncharacterized protein YxeA
MKKFLCCLVLILFISPALANDITTNDSNWGIQSPIEKQQKEAETSEKIWDKEQNQKLYENYGSQDSPAFLNRENIDPSNSEFEDKYDETDDAPYDCDAGGN